MCSETNSHIFIRVNIYTYINICVVIYFKKTNASNPADRLYVRHCSKHHLDAHKFISPTFCETHGHTLCKNNISNNANGSFIVCSVTRLDADPAGGRCVRQLTASKSFNRAPALFIRYM
jgi:hypothetical protein